MALMMFLGEAAEQSLSEGSRRVVSNGTLAAAFPEVPVRTYELAGHGYFCSVTNVNPQLEKTVGTREQEVGVARAEFRIHSSTL